MLDDNILKIKKINNNLEAKFGYIDSPEHPRKFIEPITTIISWHPKYKNQLSDTNQFQTHYDFIQYLNDNKHDIAILRNLYIFEHGNIALSIYPFTDFWDSGQIGYIYITKENNNNKEFINMSLNIESYIVNDLKMLEQYINNNVYCIDIYKNNSVILCSGELYIDNDDNTLLDKILLDFTEFDEHKIKQIQNSQWI